MRKKLFTFLLALVTSVGLSWAVPTEFANCYDCWRSPEYPNISGQCNLFNFGNPGVGNGNPSGPWKLEFVEYYNSSSTEYDDIVSSYAANQYGKSPEQMEVYRLYQWQNGAYQPVAYGVLYAYANESNPVEHAAFFEANGYYGCYLTGNTHSGGDDFNITFDEDAATGFGDLHPAPAPAVIDLATITSDYVIPDGATLTGTLQNNVVLTVADNATITLSNVDINWDATWTGGDHAGITCDNATIILAECTTNKIRGFLDGNPGVRVRPGKTITIQGTGTLYAATNGGAAAIGGGFGAQNSSARDGGNIVILDGTIFATGGNLAAGIGSGGRAKVGNITIQGGIITATGGGSGAGIGCGQTKQSDWKAQCGTITITNGVKYLKATKGSGAAHSIGKGNNDGIAVCGTVTINGTTGAISTSPYTYSPAADNVKNLINAIGTVEYTTESKDKIDAARAAYEALADYSCDVDAVNALKDAVSNYSTLTDAEAAYDALIPATPNSITINGTPQVGDNSISLTYYFDPANVPGITGYAPTLKVKCVTDNKWDEEWLSLSEIRSGTTTITLNELGSFQAGKSYEVCFAYYNGDWVDEPFQSFSFPAEEPQDPGDQTIYAGFTATAGSGGFGNEEPYRLVDGKFAGGIEGTDWTKWCANDDHKTIPTDESEACWWVDFEATNAIAVTGYILTTGNDNYSEHGRNPRSWEIKAKANATDAWTTIASVSNDNTLQDVNFTDFAFTLDNPGEYKYFRIKIFETSGAAVFQLCELRFTNSGSTEPIDPKLALLQELWNALGEDVWTGYGTQTGVISYSRGGAQAFHASFMGGTYAFDLPFSEFTAASKADQGNGEYIYTLTCNLPAQTGLGQETLHVTMNNGNIETIHSDNAGLDMTKEEEVTGWEALQAKLNAGGVIKLGALVQAPANAEALNVPAGKTVVIDLNGHSIDRNLNAAVANGSVIVNNGTLAIMGQGALVGGNTTGNGGGILNNGILTLYGGEIKNNHAAIGGGVYSTENAQFWMTAGLIMQNEATNGYPAIGGDVIFNAQAMVQINAGGDKVSIADATAALATLAYIQPVMPSYDDLEPDQKNVLLQELWNALGEDIWTGYGEQTGVISYSRGGAQAFHASFMGGTYAFDLPFSEFTAASKADQGNGEYIYTLTCNLPAQTGLGQETLHVTMNNGNIEGIHSDNAGIEMTKEEEVTGWEALQAKLNAGGVIKLGALVQAQNTDAALEVPAGKTVVIDLNGHSIDRNLASAAANGSVIVNNGTLAIMGQGALVGGNTTGNGGGILNNGILTLYGGEIKNNHAAIGGGVYSTENAQFWMTAGLIMQNEATNGYPAIGGEVIFNAQAMVQINAGGDKVSIADATAALATLAYIQPVMPDYEDLNPSANDKDIIANVDPENPTVHYSTFYDSAIQYELPAGVEAYVADLSGSDLVLTKIAGAGQVIPNDVAVILRSSVDQFTLTASVAIPVSFTANNDLEGVDEATTLESLSIDPLKCYVLSGKSHDETVTGVGFYRIYGTTLKAHKAYVIYNGSVNSNLAPRRMRFIFDQENTTTGVENVQGDKVQSTKLIENGVLYIIRDGVRYNAQGQIVK